GGGGGVQQMFNLRRPRTPSLSFLFVRAHVHVRVGGGRSAIYAGRSTSKAAARPRMARTFLASDGVAYGGRPIARPGEWVYADAQSPIYVRRADPNLWGDAQTCARRALEGFLAPSFFFCLSVRVVCVRAARRYPSVMYRTVLASSPFPLPPLCSPDSTVPAALRGDAGRRATGFEGDGRARVSWYRSAACPPPPPMIVSL
ncbi:hypothetical protein FB451DRAFT_1247876, partial [Mycena latifolia]